MNQIAPDILDRLRAVVGDKGVIADPAEMRPYLTEWRDLWHGVSPLILRPASTEEVAEIVRLCAETGTKLVPQGGNTSLCGGSVPFEGGDEIVLSLSRMHAVREIDLENDTITVEAGCILQDVQQAAEEAGRLFPMRIAAEGSCQIGGNLSTNAGGTAVLRYGNMRDLVLGLEVVLPDGRIWHGLRGLRKDNTGYDLKQLFIGAEGTLGIVTAAVLKLYPRPAAVETAFMAVPDVAAAVAMLGTAKALSGNQVTTFELVPRLGLDMVLRHVADTHDPLEGRHDWYVLMELSAGRDTGALKETMEAILVEGYEQGRVLDATMAASEAQSQALWKLRESMSEAQKYEGGSIKHDVSVPVSRMAAFIAEASEYVVDLIPGTRIVAFGHIGDGNVHFNPSQPPEMDKQAFLDRWDEVGHRVYEKVRKFGGSISAEHGLGRLKRDEIVQYKDPVEMELMRRIKRSLDPQNIMNPGKVLNPEG
ncbi:FAD-binding oxidoreductase [Marinibaculum pumilum]|uniref:FAD-binding oxidoreductase n=1 Tax=Marinibaculum pumilum TaxID=1766165 RepID=A0ABV7LAP1_9PROT